VFEDLNGKVAVVTGGARGLGLEMADALAEMGCAVALLDVGEGVKRSATDLSDRRHVPTLGLHTDVTDDTALDDSFRRISADLGTPSILVNAAGVTAWVEAEDMPAAEWRRVLDINLTGTFLTSQAFARAVFASRGAGTVVNVSSMSAFVVNVPQRQAAYNVSKAGVDHLTRSLAVEWVDRGIRVNAIAPGYFLSDMTRQFIDSNPVLGDGWRSRIPAGRLGEPPDLRGLVVFLASDASRYVVGESVVIDGGYTLV
jgi:NAD(P)-dependent dehydrogenase (short-subunit alcohol dehydrogenase family)